MNQKNKAGMWELQPDGVWVVRKHDKIVDKLKVVDLHLMRIEASKRLGASGLRKLREERFMYDPSELAAHEGKDTLTIDEVALIFDVDRRSVQRWLKQERPIPPGPVRLFCMTTGLPFEEWDPLNF